MAGFKIEGFIGSLPGKSPRLLPENTAVSSRNQRVESGALDPLCLPRTLVGMTADKKFVYRIPVGVPSDVSQPQWIGFEDRNTDVVRTPVVNDIYERYYWASPSTGFRYATKAALLAGGPGAGLIAGVPRPGTPVTLDVIAGTGATSGGVQTGPKVTRSYIVTFVSDYGEEGAPGPAAEATGAADQDWRLRDIPQPAIVSGYTSVNKIRIYRTVTAASGATVFNFVVDLPVGQLIYFDRISDLVVSGTIQLDSLDNDPPPPIDGLVLMPNGVLVGFKGNNLYFSESYKPHAWPAAYTLAVQFPIVGLAVFGNSCIVCTQGNPCAVTGNNGAVMTLTQTDTALPCLSRQSIVAAPEGVYYATNDGLVLYGPSGPSIVTDDIFGRKYWEENYNPTTIDAALHHGLYAGIRTIGGEPRGFMVVSGTIVEIDIAGVGEAFVTTDIWSNTAILVNQNVIQEWLPDTGPLDTVVWRSKVFQLLARVNLAVFQVFHDGGPNDCTITIWHGGQIIFDRAVINGRVYKLPARKRELLYQVGIRANARVHSFYAAQSVNELKKQ